MGRPLKVRAELKDTGVILSPLGVERARLTLNDMLIINEQELFFEITRLAQYHGRRVPVTKLNELFSLSGTWGYDSSVEVTLRSLWNQKVIGCDTMDSDKIYFVWPVVTPAKALKIIPQYTTRAELMAGLEPLHDE